MSDPVIAVYHRVLGNRFGRLVLVYVLPAALFVITVIGKVSALQGIWNHPNARERSWSGFLLSIAYQVLSLVFYSLLVALYAHRRPLLQPVQSTAGLLAALAGSFVPFALPLFSRVHTGTTLSLISLCLMVLGLVITVTGLAALRRHFGILPEVRGLVQTGLYRYARHPIYTGEIVTFLGIMLPLFNAFAAVVFIVFVLLQYVRSRFEEAALCRQFPEYATYRKHTRRFIPGVA